MGAARASKSQFRKAGKTDRQPTEMPRVSTARDETWKRLFGRALSILDTAVSAGMPAEDWSFGGGTVLMLKHHHRFSKDIDIFVPDPQHLGFLTPRLNDTAEIEMTD